MITSAEMLLYAEIKDANYPFAKMNYNYFIRQKNVDRQGYCTIYINVRINGQRKKINTEIKVKPELWDTARRNFKICDETKDLQLLLDDMDSKITAAKIAFRLNNVSFTMERFVDVLRNASYESFYSFFDKAIEYQRLADRTVIKHKAIVSKMKEFMPELTFSDFNKMWFDRFRDFLRKQKKNKDVTINSNVSVIKKYLYLAKDYGIRLNIDLDKIPVGSTKGRIVWLDEHELRKLKEYYYSSFIQKHHRLTLGYFLFACYTSLRISDIYERTREEILSGMLEFYTVKSQRKHLQVLSINRTTREIVEHSPELFVEKKAEANLNIQLKDIAKTVGISKNLTMHVGRHTFATNYILKEGNVKFLQEILGHRKIETTMVYVHITNRQAAMTTDLLD